MPHVIISTKITLEAGPTIVGDEQSDPALMRAIGANLTHQVGNNYKEFKCEEAPRIVLDKLELLGFRVLSVTGIGQTCVWTLHKPLTGAAQSS